MAGPHYITQDHDEDSSDFHDKELRLAYVSPALAEDVAALLALPAIGHDGRSEWSWVRLRDGTLMLAVFPQGETYERFSEGGVCDFGEENSNG